MAVPEVEAVLEFLRKSGLLKAETMLKDEIAEKGDLSSFDLEKFFFPMMPPPPPVRIPSRQDVGASGGEWDKSSGLSSDDQFLSLGSSTSDVCSSSDFINPYGLHSSSTPNSESSSDRLSQFGTARAYQDLDMQNDLQFFDDKSDEGHFMTPCSRASESFLTPSEDKFVMTSETNNGNSLDMFGKAEEGEQELGVIIPYSYGKSLDLIGELHGECIGKQSCLHLEKNNLDDLKPSKDVKDPEVIDNNWFEKSTSDYDSQQALLGIDIMDNEDERFEANEEPEAVGDQEQEGGSADDILILEGLEDEYEVFDLRIIHRKNKTGFEENKDIPIVLNTVFAGRYYVTKYLGSAAFSKVVQARDLHTGVDVCLKIIKNDKDFFDQSLDEIKLLKLVNKHDPADEHHILRLYDYFYHQEHLFIVCELLRANLYEFQKFNQESGGDVYFTLSRLQVITRQCLEAVEYLHGLGIIHCDLKPENILIKSYTRSEIKIIDLGSSCFKSDNLCLYVQSRSYRAPEVILGLPYDGKIDIWSLGCILAELCSGEVLFPNDMVVTILARMTAMLGPIDHKMLVRGQETPKYFTEQYDLYYINEETEQVEFIIPEESSSSLENHLQISDVGFVDFVRSLLQINPKRRPTAKEALEHPWLLQEYPRSY